MLIVKFIGQCGWIEVLMYMEFCTLLLKFLERIPLYFLIIYLYMYIHCISVQEIYLTIHFLPSIFIAWWRISPFLNIREKIWQLLWAHWSNVPLRHFLYLEISRGHAIIIYMLLRANCELKCCRCRRQDVKSLNLVKSQGFEIYVHILRLWKYTEI